MYVCMYVRMYVRMYVCMYVCMYVKTSKYSQLWLQKIMDRASESEICEDITELPLNWLQKISPDVSLGK